MKRYVKNLTAEDNAVYKALCIQRLLVEVEERETISFSLNNCLVYKVVIEISPNGGNSVYTLNLPEWLTYFSSPGWMLVPVRTNIGEFKVEMEEGEYLHFIEGVGEVGPFRIEDSTCTFYWE